MTNTIAIPATSPGPITDQDPRYALARSVSVARCAVEHVSEENASNQSPCNEWDARHVAGHIIAVLDRLDGFARGVPHEQLPILHDLRVDDLLVEFDRAARAVHQAWSDDSVLSTVLILPFAAVPGAIAAPIYVSELLTHSWDLATALGVDIDWPDDLVEPAVQAVRHGIPAERGPDLPFDDVVDLPADAAPIHRLVAWVGRDPRP